MGCKQYVWPDTMPDPDYRGMSFAQWFARALSTEDALSLEGVSCRVGVPVETVEKWLDDRTPPTADVQRILLDLFPQWAR